MKSTPSLTRVQVFGKISSSVLRRDLLHFSPENPKGATIFSAFPNYSWCFGILPIRTKRLFFLGFYLLFFIFIFFFLFQIEDKAAWQKYKVQMGVKLKHKVTDEKTWLNKETTSLWKKRKTGSIIYNGQTVGFRDQGGERENGMTRQGT